MRLYAFTMTLGNQAKRNASDIAAWKNPIKVTIIGHMKLFWMRWFGSHNFYSIFTRIIMPLLSTRALTTFELAYRTFCFLVYDLSTLSVIKFTVNIINNDIENTVLKKCFIVITYYYNSRLQQDPNIIVNMLLWPIVPFARSHHCKREVNITLFELRFDTLVELTMFWKTTVWRSYVGCLQW